MFAQYSSSFTKWVGEALDASESTESAEKRWDNLKKFEVNFNHWYAMH